MIASSLSLILMAFASGPHPSLSWVVHGPASPQHKSRLARQHPHAPYAQHLKHSPDTPLSGHGGMFANRHFDNDLLDDPHT